MEVQIACGKSMYFALQYHRSRIYEIMYNIIGSDQVSILYFAS